jgi:beta-galactosidase
MVNYGTETEKISFIYWKLKFPPRPAFMPAFNFRLRIKKYCLVFLLLCAVTHLPTFAYTPPASNRAIVNLDSTWKFNLADVSGAQNISFNDAAWTSINLPHTWNNLDGQDGGGNYYRGIGWYRKHFTVSSSYSGRKLYLKFSGANQVADVYVNGTLIGEHKGGYAAFCFDITSAAIVGADNVLAVKVNNASSTDIPPLSADYTFFGGIYRDVNLLVTDLLAVTPLDYASPGVYCKTPAVSASSATIRIVSKIRNANTSAKTTTVTTVIADASGATVATLTGSQSIAASSSYDFVQSTTIATPHLWNGFANPYLYRVYVQVSDGTTTTDVVDQPLGIRFFSVDPNNGFYLNGAYLDLHGVNRHQDWLDSGWAIGPAEHLRDFALLREMGCTGLRLSHYQHAEYFYHLCDSAGMVVWAEIPVVNGVTVSDSFYANAKQQLTELIRQNYNHPAIFVWGIGNEISSSPDPNPLLDTLHRLVHREDSTRLSTYASNTKNDTSTNNALNWHTDLTGFNQYFGWYTDNGPLTAFPGWADRMHAVYPTRCIGMSEYGAGSSIYQHMDNPPAPDPYGRPHTEEYENLCHESYWDAMRTRTYLWCKFIWCMHDFASDGRNEGDWPGRNDKGVVTYDRKTLKDAFYWYKANWTTDPVVYICSRRASLRDTTPIPIKVYSNCTSVELFVNGVSKGTKTSTDNLFTWTGNAIPNKYNLVKAIGTRNAQTYVDSVNFGYFDCPDATLSQGKTATASSTQTGNTAANAVDGNSTATRWSASDATYPQWWMVDLGSSVDIGCVRIKWYKGTDYRNYYYRIEVSDQQTTGFVTVADRTGNMFPGAVENIVTAHGRYVRITVTGAVPLATSWASMYEVKIYGPSPTQVRSPQTETLHTGISTKNTVQGITVNLGTKEDYTLKLVDCRGKTVYATSGSGRQAFISGKTLCGGMYLLQVRYGSETIVKKVIRM